MGIQPICDVDTPDPWMIAANGKYYLTFTCGNRVEIWSSHNPTSFHQCHKSVVWQPLPDSPWSADVWAPELHGVNGQWYIYFSGAHPGQGNASHRTLVLRSSHPDPMHSHAWQFLGPLKGMPDHWAIDATIFPLHGKLYCCWSGWPTGDHSDTEQELFLVELKSPEEGRPETVRSLSKPTLDWERLDNRGINEGPQFLHTPAFTGIVYSACGSWTNKYKLGALQLMGPDPLDPASWQKWGPVMMSDPDGGGGPHGPGHASFIASGFDPGTVFCIFHATGSPTDGWGNRKAYCYPLGPEVFLGRKTVLCSQLILPEEHDVTRSAKGLFKKAKQMFDEVVRK